jgi:hypothetical protein
MTFLAAIIALFFFFLELGPFLRLSLKALFSFPECYISFLIYFVGMSLRFSLKIMGFVCTFIFLGPSFKVIVEARYYCDQVRLSLKEFLYGYSIFDALE